MHILIKNHRKVRKIGYCILLKDNFPTDEIWEEFFSGIPENKYKIVIHGSENIKNNIDQKCKILLEKTTYVPTIETKWGHYSIVKAQISVLREILKDEKIDRLCFISGNCIPIKSFKKSKEYLEKNNKSLFALFNMSVRFPRFNELLKHGVHPEDVGFHHQWCVLRRDHAELLVKNYEEYIEWFKELHAPDECAILTTLLHYKVPKNQIKQVSCLKKIEGEDGLQGSTFTHWHDISYKYKFPFEKMPNSSPKLYNLISEEEFNHIIYKAPCIFARKFTKDSKVILYNDDQISIFEFLKRAEVL